MNPVRPHDFSIERAAVFGNELTKLPGRRNLFRPKSSTRNVPHRFLIHRIDNAIASRDHIKKQIDPCYADKDVNDAGSGAERAEQRRDKVERQCTDESPVEGADNDEDKCDPA